MDFSTFIAISLLGAISAGCSSVRVIGYGGGQNCYDGAFELATIDGKINTYVAGVAGTPFSNTDSNSTNWSISMIYGSIFGRDLNFVAAKPNTEKYCFHIAVFNAANPVGVSDICQDANRIKTRPERQTTSMQAIFCQGGYPIGSAEGYVGRLQDPSDPKSRDLVRQVAFAMVPGYDGRRSSGFSPF